MSSTETRFKADAPLAEKLRSAQDGVRSRPADAQARVYLFQLQCVLGQWEKALLQLQAAATLDPAAIPMAQTYRQAIRSELQRESVFAGRTDPTVLGAPAQWVGMLTEALRLVAAGRVQQAAELRAAAWELAPACAGTLNGAEIAWVADADMLLGPICEALVGGQYHWVPFERIESLEIDPPSDLRDLVWCSGSLQLFGSERLPVLLPSRYCGTGSSDDDALRLSRLTRWVDLGADTWQGTGQKVFTTDLGDTAMLDIRALALRPQED